MRRPTRPAPRAAFTLIELLVVVSILAILGAIVAGGIGMVRTAQMTKNTEQTLTKLQLAVAGQWKAVADKCRQDAQNNAVPSDVFAAAGGDPDRAAALWTYMNLRNEMPQSFAEASTPVTFTTAGGTASMARRKTFDPFVGTFVRVDDGTPITPAQQSAALLYVILAEKGYKGWTFPSDDTTTNAQSEIGPFTRTTPTGTTQVTFRVYKDAWGTPITFQRFFTNAEVQRSSYTNTKGASRDSLDPLGKLAGWGTAVLPDAAGKAAAENAIGAPGTGFVFDGTNKLATVVSVGPDKDGAFPPTGDDDDLFGFRLTRQGNRGD